MKRGDLVLRGYSGASRADENRAIQKWWLMVGLGGEFGASRDDEKGDAGGRYTADEIDVS